MTVANSADYLFFRCQLFVWKVHLLLLNLLMINGWAGQIVGIIYCQTATPQESGKTFNAIFTPSDYHKARWLEEENALNTTFAEVALVRITLAWITGILLLVSTLMGVSVWWRTRTINIMLIKNTKETIFCVVRHINR